MKKHPGPVPSGYLGSISVSFTHSRYNGMFCLLVYQFCYLSFGSVTLLAAISRSFFCIHFGTIYLCFLLLIAGIYGSSNGLERLCKIFVAENFTSPLPKLQHQMLGGTSKRRLCLDLDIGPNDNFNMHLVQVLMSSAEFHQLYVYIFFISYIIFKMYFFSIGQGWDEGLWSSLLLFTDPHSVVLGAI